MATNDQFIETPVGKKVGKIWEKLEILGISHLVTQTGNQPNDEDLHWDEFVDIDVPVGTLTVVPTVESWFLGHGRLDPELFDPLNVNESQVWNSSDRPWGFGQLSVRVVDVNAPDHSVNPPRQTGQLHIKMHLSDYNLDDTWFGMIAYTLVFLGVAPRTEGITATGLTSRRVQMQPFASKRIT